MPPRTVNGYVIKSATRKSVRLGKQQVELAGSSGNAPGTEQKEQDSGDAVDSGSTPMNTDTLTETLRSSIQQVVEQAIAKSTLKTPTKRKLEESISVDLDTDEQEGDSTVLHSLVKSGTVNWSPDTVNAISNILTQRRSGEKSTVVKKLNFEDNPSPTKKAKKVSDTPLVSRESTRLKETNVGAAPPNNADFDQKKLSMYSTLDSTDVSLILNWRQSFEATATLHGWDGVLLRGDYLRRDANGEYVGTPTIMSRCVSNGVLDRILAEEWSQYLTKVDQALKYTLMKVVKEKTIASMIGVYNAEGKSAKELWDSIKARYLTMTDYEKIIEQRSIQDMKPSKGQSLEDFINGIEARVANLRVRTPMSDSEVLTLQKHTLLAGISESQRQDLKKFFDGDWETLRKGVVEHERLIKIGPTRAEKANLGFNNREFKALRCKDCGNKGHKNKWHKECKSNPKRGGGYNKESNQDEKRNCAWCGKSGHIPRECHIKKRGDDPLPGTYAAKQGWKNRHKANKADEKKPSNE